MPCHPIEQTKHFETLSPLIKHVYRNGGVVCGGFARHLGTKDDSTFGDIDVWPENEESLKNLLAFFTRLLHKIRNNKKVSINSSNYNGIENTRFVIPFKDLYMNTSAPKSPYTFNIIHNPGKPEEIISDFDFTVCQAFLPDPRIPLIYAVDSWLIDNKEKILNIGSKTHKKSFYRIIKYIHKGYMPTYDTILNFISNTDENNPRKIAQFLGKITQMLQITRIMDKEDPNRTLVDKLVTLGKLMHAEGFNEGFGIA